MIAYCGLNCTECPAYIATKANDDKLREEAANTPGPDKLHRLQVRRQTFLFLQDMWN